VGSVIVEILHSVEGGDVEQWLEPRNIFLCLRLLTLSWFYSLFTCTLYCLLYCKFYLLCLL